jgi:cyclic pyranopterin phosphate synthase
MVKAVEKDEKGQYPITEITDIKVLEKRKGD